MTHTDQDREVRIATAGREDLPDIASLAAVVWRAHYPGIISQAQIDYMLAKMYALDVLEAELRDGIAYDQLFVGSELAGFSACGPMNERELKLHKLYVHPQWQRHGFGTRLLRNAESAGRERGFTTLVLAVNKKNTKAIAAYRKNSFQIREPVVTDIGGGFMMDDYIMAKRL